jgi:acyl-CoA dehydrogenase
MLPKLITGDYRTCFGVYVLTPHRTEPDTGLETLKLKTQAKKDGNDYLISGQKMYVTKPSHIPLCSSI